MIYKKIGKQKLDNTSYELLENIVYRMHVTVSKNDDVPIKVYDKIYHLMHQVAKTNVAVPIELLKAMLANQGQYKFKLHIFYGFNRVFGGYLKLLATIFLTQQGKETYGLYNQIKGYIKANIKRNVGYLLEYKKYMARSIFNIGIKISDDKDRDLFFESWLKTDSGISKKFQSLLRNLW